MSHVSVMAKMLDEEEEAKVEKRVILLTRLWEFHTHMCKSLFSQSQGRESPELLV